MASDGPSEPPTASGSTNLPPLPTNDSSPPKYVPQFSAATEMILKRIQSGVSGTSSLTSFTTSGPPGYTPPGYEDMRRNVLLQMKTSNNIELPATPPTNRRSRGGSASKAATGRTSTTPSGSATGSPGGGKGKGKRGGRTGGKRKRAKDDDTTSEEESDGNMSKLGEDSDSDMSEDVTVLPKITQSGRQVNRPAQFVPSYEPATKRRAPSRKAQEQALCKRCGRGHSPDNNMIVFCDGCNLGWHQLCHDPVVSQEVVQDEKSSWFCADCSKKKGTKSKTPESTKGVSWQGKSTEEKRAYLSSLPHQQLVSLLLQATVLHPNLPIFPATTPAQTTASLAPAKRMTPANMVSVFPVSKTVIPQQPFPPSAASSSGLFSRSEANPNAPINFIRKIAPGQTPPASSSFTQPSFQHASSAPPTVTAQGDSRESTPASPPYPKPGTGLMAKLGPDNEDAEWLVDDNDYMAFSHMIFDDNGEMKVLGAGGVPSA